MLRHVSFTSLQKPTSLNHIRRCWRRRSRSSPVASRDLFTGAEFLLKRLLHVLWSVFLEDYMRILKDLWTLTRRCSLFRPGSCKKHGQLFIKLIIKCLLIPLKQQKGKVVQHFHNMHVKLLLLTVIRHSKGFYKGYKGSFLSIKKFLIST